MRKILNTFFKILEYLFFKLNFIRLSQEASIAKSANLKGARISGNVTIEENCKILNGVQIQTASSVTIDRYSSINGPGTDLISAINTIKIGAFCSIARGVAIQEFNHNFKTISSYTIQRTLFNDTESKDFNSKGPINIGNDVWIGAQCVIISGCTIGDGAIIGANSLVKGEIPPYAIAGGSPAKVIGYRFDKEIVDALLSIKWWEWDIEKIRKNKKLFEGTLTFEMINSLK